MIAPDINKKGFAPLVNKNTQILILGSLPGNVSILKNEYYGHPRNQFWRIIGAYFHQNIIDFSYKNRCLLLINHDIGLWDVYAQAVRKSSLDVDIKLPIYNPLNQLSDQLPQLNKILLNGKLAQKEFYKQQHHLGLFNAVKIYNLPSTSPANAQMSFEEKYAAWQFALEN